MSVFIFDIIRAGGPVPARTDRHYLAGKVTVNGSPAARRVVVLDRDTFAYRASTWSDGTTGDWDFAGLPEYEPESLIVLALDESGDFNAEVADHISQVSTVGQ